MPRLHLDYDPYRIFRSSRTPPGLYARQKWLHEETKSSRQEDFSATVKALYQNRSGSGLWQNSIIKTIHQLFGLHLTVRTCDPLIKKSLEQLLYNVNTALSSQKTGQVHPEQLLGLPFAPGRWLEVVVPATLFLAGIFDQASDSAVLTLYERTVSSLVQGRLDQLAGSAVHNLLRALVVHPDYAGHAITRSVVSWFADRQTAQGDWGRDIPFYQALNALAHLSMVQADIQCRKAFNRLASLQHPDGSWGENQKEWCTFLVIHALRNKGLL